MFQIAIDLNVLLYGNLPTSTFAQRLKKAKFIAGLSQMDLVKLTGLSRSCINDLECGYRTNIKQDML